MKKVRAIIEKSADGMFSIFMDAEEMPYLVTGTGSTVAEAIEKFEGGYADIREYFVSEGKAFEEVEFDYIYDVASFLQHYAYAFSLAGLERITGVNQKQLGHYISGYRKPSKKTIRKIELSIKEFSKELSSVQFA